MFNKIAFLRVDIFDGGLPISYTIGMNQVAQQLLSKFPILRV